VYVERNEFGTLSGDELRDVLDPGADLLTGAPRPDVAASSYGSL
jgi:hypothetical protein